MGNRPTISEIKRIATEVYFVPRSGDIGIFLAHKHKEYRGILVERYGEPVSLHTETDNGERALDIGVAFRAGEVFTFEVNLTEAS